MCSSCPYSICTVFYERLMTDPRPRPPPPCGRLLRGFPAFFSHQGGESFSLAGFRVAFPRCLVVVSPLIQVDDSGSCWLAGWFALIPRQHSSGGFFLIAAWLHLFFVCRRLLPCFLFLFYLDKPDHLGTVSLLGGFWPHPRCRRAQIINNWRYVYCIDQD